MEYTLVYDASMAELPWGIILHVTFMLVIGTIISIVFILQKNRKDITIICIISWIVFVLLFGGLGVGNVVCKHLKCKKWTETKNYSVVEGLVTNFHPMPKGGHDTERFTVKGVRFKYSDFDSSKGGFNNTASHGGPIREGLYVRIAHRDGRILKLEIKKDSEIPDNEIRQ